MLLPNGILRRFIITLTFSDLFQHLLGPFQYFDLRRFQHHEHLLQLLESLATEGVCNELPKPVEVNRQAVMSEDGLKVGGDENSIERAINKDLLELLSNPSVNFGGTAPSSMV
jgi:hypothetical protein